MGIITVLSHLELAQKSEFPCSGWVRQLSGDPYSIKWRSILSYPSGKCIKLTYADHDAAPGEKVRIALVLSGVPFIDNRVSLANLQEDWAMGLDT